MKTTDSTQWKAVAQMPDGYTIEDSRGRVLAFTQCDEEYNEDNPITKDEEFKNALLLAAAPELLQALQTLLKEARQNSFNVNGSINDTFAEEKAQAAINKATNQ